MKADGNLWVYCLWCTRKHSSQTGLPGYCGEECEGLARQAEVAWTRYRRTEVTGLHSGRLVGEVSLRIGRIGGHE